MNDDLISRQAVINAIESHGSVWIGMADDVTVEQAMNKAADAMRNLMIMIVNNMPAEHPELSEWCTTCKEYDQKAQCCPRFSAVIRSTVEELKTKYKEGDDD